MLLGLRIWFYTAPATIQATMKVARQTQKWRSFFDEPMKRPFLQVEFFVLKRRPQAGIVLTTRRVFQVTKTPRFLGLMGCAGENSGELDRLGGLVTCQVQTFRGSLINDAPIQEICSNLFAAFRCLQVLDSYACTTTLYCCKVYE